MAFTIVEFNDLVHILETQPDWRRRLLYVLFPETFIDLPRIVAEMAEANLQFQVQTAGAFTGVHRRLDETRTEMRQGFAEAAGERQRIEDKVDRGFAEAAGERQRIEGKVDRGFAKAEAERKLMRHDIGQLKGDVAEMRYLDRSTGIFGRWLSGGHDGRSEVAGELRQAIKDGRILDSDYDQIMAADVLWAGKLDESGERIVLVMEVSWTVDKHDVDRARDRAARMRAAGIRAIAVAAGKEWSDAVTAHARRARVAMVNDSRADSAAWGAALASAA